MKRERVIAVAAMMAVLVSISCSAVEENYQENQITISEAGPFEQEKHVIIRSGREVSFKIKVFQTEFFGQSTISANAVIDNTTAEKVKAVYSISFHDGEGKLIGCHQGAWDLDPDSDVNYGSGIIYADPGDIASVTSYKLRTMVIELDEETGQ